jgi:DNA polymerase
MTIEPWTAEPFVPSSSRLATLARAAADCQGCPLYRDASQTVFGAGPAHPLVVFVGEQPGDVEDRRGTPFVGPAGRVLWECVEESGLDRDRIYATNAVKHFKHEQRGKRRLHKRPSTDEIEACHPWLASELRAIPNVPVVALGAVAARALFGRSVTIGSARLQRHDLDGRSVVVTYHPSAVLRADERAAEIRRALVDDLRTAATLVAQPRK